MKVNIDGPLVVYKDNQSAIDITKNEGYHIRAKHIDIRYHFVRDQVKNKVTQLEYIITKLQLANFLTKYLLTKKFHFLAAKANIGN